MSHFPVLVCLPGDTSPEKLEEVLGDVMEPWNEHSEVEPYRSYEEGSVEDFWWVRAVRRGAASHRELREKGAEALARERIAAKLPANAVEGHDWGRATRTVEEQAPEWAEDARWAVRLGVDPASDGRIPLTWEAVVRLHNEKYHPGNELALVGDATDDRLHYDPESGRAYTMTTYNPESKWDYWRIGGRWKDYFVYRERVPGLIWGERSWDSPKETHVSKRRCDGGPISALDFEALRSAEAREAEKRYDRWEEITATRPPATAWEHFAGLAKLGELTWDEARRRYNGQPVIMAATKEFGGWGDCPVAEFLPPREEYVAEARRGAVPGYALVTLDREWIAPGRMGWFGMSSEGAGERSGYRVAVNQYLDQLDPETFLVVLDCHI